MVLQTNTKNTSFLKVSYLLKEMGIKNNNFMLRLYDESLLNVDPFDYDNLTLEQKIRIHLEIKRNFWYYVREITRIHDSPNGLFELHRGNCALYTLLLLNLNVIFLTPRQCYKTTSTMNFEAWGLDFGYNAKSTTGLFTLSAALSANNLSRLRSIRDAYPTYLKNTNRKNKNNATTIEVVSDGYTKQIVTKAVGNSEETAEDSARGYSYNVLLYDEFAFITYIAKHYGTAIYAYGTAARSSEEKGEFHHVLLTTTAGNLWQECGQWAYRLIQNSAAFNEKIYDMTYEDENGILQFDKQRIYQYITSQSLGDHNVFTKFVKVEYEYFELGKADDYLETQKEWARNNPDPTSFEREILMKWQAQSGDHPLGKDRVERLRNHSRKPNTMITIDNIYSLNIYRDKYDKEIPYVMGVDCSGNLGKDYSTLVAIDPTNFEVVATMRINQHSIIRFASTIAYIMINIFPRSIAIIERNAMGVGVVDFLKTKVPLNRIWKDEKEIYGVNQTKETRDLLFNDVLKVAAMYYYDKIHDKNIINETVLLEYDKRGRIDHAPENHDDTLMAYLWAMWFLLHAKNKSFYIDPIYIGLNLNEDNYIKNEDIQEDINMKRRNMYTKMSRWTGNSAPENLLDGTLSPEELIMKQNQQIIEQDQETLFNRELSKSKYGYVGLLKEIKDKEVKETITDKINEYQYQKESDIDRIDERSLKDVEVIDKEAEEERKQEAMDKAWRLMNYRSIHGKFPGI